MIGNPRYGRIGTFVLPAYTLTEALGPLVEGLGYLVLGLAVTLGIVDFPLLVLFIAVTSGVGVFLSWFGALSEVYSFRRYEDPGDVVMLLGHGVLENVGYRQWKALLAWRALFEYLRGDRSWGEMTRQNFGESATEEGAIEETRDADQSPCCRLASARGWGEGGSRFLLATALASRCDRRCVP